MKLIHPRRIIGIDAGLRFTGLCCFQKSRKNDWELIETVVYSTYKFDKSVAQDNRRRIEYISDKLSDYITDRKPEMVISELPHGGSRNAKAMSAMMLAFATVVITCRRLDVKLGHVTPNELKKFVAPGLRKVPKEAIIEFVTRRFGSSLLPTNSKCEHVADAVACALTYMNKANIK